MQNYIDAMSILINFYAVALSGTQYFMFSAHKQINPFSNSITGDIKIGYVNQQDKVS